jgi:exodeoxyribonuclease VII large subunit
MSTADLQSTKTQVYSVSQLNKAVRTFLEGKFPLIWVEGEISNLARPSSGHMYFSLKDEEAQVRCAMFRNKNMLLRFKPENGMQIKLRARVSLYEGRGEFQLIAEHMEEAGFGALQRAFELLKQKLSEEGLFSEPHKKPLPAYPRRVGVITSSTGAALRDILHVLKRRFPLLPVLIYPVPVQGEGAAPAIVRALEKADKSQACDILILARGGGSLEDLWAFNEEPVARAIYDCSLPIITGIGHETDFTIADFVADQRAPTPSAAAELVSPNQDEIFNQIVSYRKYLFDLIERIKRNKQQNLEHVRTRLQQQHPQRRLEQLALRVDELEHRLSRGWEALLHHRQFRLSSLHQSLQLHNPAQRLKQLNTNLEKTRLRLDQGITLRLRGAITRLAEASRALNAYSPLATLDRGYALITQEGSLVKSIAQVSPGDRITARLSDGSMECRIETLSANDDPRQERDKT